jgi:SOS response regulatory protein OraA/RecX
LTAPGKTAGDVAARAWARRDRSEADVRRILDARGVPETDADTALETLRRIGAVDDERFASRAAEALGARGLGDAAIIARLEREGISRDLAAAAVASLPPEAQRAALLAARRGAGAKTARWLARRGFTAEAIETAVPAVAGDMAAELG